VRRQEGVRRPEGGEKAGRCEKACRGLEGRKV